MRFRSPAMSIVRERRLDRSCFIWFLADTLLKIVVLIGWIPCLECRHGLVLVLRKCTYSNVHNPSNICIVYQSAILQVAQKGAPITLVGTDQSQAIVESPAKSWRHPSPRRAFDIILSTLSCSVRSCTVATLSRYPQLYHVPHKHPEWQMRTTLCFPDGNLMMSYQAVPSAAPPSHS